MSPQLFLVPVAVIAVAQIVHRTGPPELDVFRRALEGRAAPWILGLVSALIVWFVWGSLGQVGVFHDERAYLLQAEIFGSGRWTSAGRPMPAFFEQMHVLVTPVLASKYPPGHSLLLVPGTWIGLPGIVPLALSGLAGGLVFVLARRVANPWVALLTWLLWTTTTDNLRWRASYLSEVTTSALVLLAWWALLRWRERGERGMLLLVAAAVGWGAITRPLTMLAFGLPIGLVVLHDSARRGAWRDLTLAMATGIAVLCVLPAWSAGTTGNWRETPLERYTSSYIPFDRMGFGLDSTAATRPLPRDLRSVMPPFMRVHERYTPGAVPGQLTRRIAYVASGTWGGWRLLLLAFAAMGLLSLVAASAFAVGSSALLVLAYLVYAHPANWTLYYLEALPALALLTALGVWRVLLAGLAIANDKLPADRDMRADKAAFGMLILAVLSLAPAATDVRRVRKLIRQQSTAQARFRAAVEALPGGKSIVFVRYAETHSGHVSFVENVPDLQTAERWIVYDRGDANAELMRFAPDRAAYLADEARSEILPVQAGAGAPSRP